MLASIFCKINMMRRDEKGATAIEYGLIAGLVAIVIIGGLTLLGGKLSAMFTEVGNSL